MTTICGLRIDRELNTNVVAVSTGVFTPILYLGCRVVIRIAVNHGPFIMSQELVGAGVVAVVAAIGGKIFGESINCVVRARFRRY